MPTPSCRRRFTRSPLRAAKAADFARMRVAPGALPDGRRQGIHAPSHVRHAARDPYLRARRNRDHDRSGACSRRAGITGSIVVGTDRRRPFTGAMSATRVRAAGGSGVNGTPGTSGSSGAAMVSCVNPGRTPSRVSRPSRYWRRRRTGDVRPTSCPRAVSATRPRPPRLSSTMRTLAASVQRRRRPVSMTERTSSSGLNLSSDVTPELIRSRSTQKDAPRRRLTQ